MVTRTKKTAAKKTTKTKRSTANRKITIANTEGKQLVIVESPAKARTVGQILGKGYVVTASLGHVRDLPKGKIGVDLEQDFEPSYVTMQDKRSLLNQLKKAGDQAKNVYLATDPDREGEAISWHIQTAAGWDKHDEPPKRVVFHEITKQAVKEAFDHPREIDMSLVNAQQARRILDRLVGYQISPLLWRRVQRGLSAGRVQSVALRMVTEREREILAFIPEESWTLEATLNKSEGVEGETRSFIATLYSVKGHSKRLKIEKENDVRAYESDVRDGDYTVTDVRKRDVKQRPSPPFTTSTMQQDSGRKLRFTAQRTMSVAQQLYEGISVTGEGSVGLITYMRTDSVQVASTAVDETRGFILGKYGNAYLPDKPRTYKTGAKSAQEAHEAIRPTSVQRTPDSLKSTLTPDQHRLYSLIWSRMLASQMADARSEATTVDIDVTGPQSGNGYVFRAAGSVLRFAGFRTLYLETSEDSDDEDDKKVLPPLAKGNVLNCSGLESLQHFTQPPSRFTEASLIKAMEENGLGRPSTYAPTIGTLLDRNYMEKEQNRLHPTTLGMTVTDLLTEYFANVMDIDFTAKMEEELDEVSRGERDWVPMLREFYGPFEKALGSAEEKMPRVKIEEETDEICDTCSKPMVIKTGRFGRFIACTGFPDCKTTRPILNKLGILCPDCSGDLVERKARGRRQPFFGCSRYPECEFISNRRPVSKVCPECSGLMVENTQTEISCTKCAWKEAVIEDNQELAAVGD
ncbi:MAG: type I DNA topoisomerase [Chloroflexota bacterium]|nr:type I DNA topoisomerase [Chloroflexota bacterium]